MSLSIETLHFNEVHPDVLKNVTEVTTAEFLIKSMVISPIPKESRINVLANHLGKDDRTMVQTIKMHLKIIANII